MKKLLNFLKRKLRNWLFDDETKTVNHQIINYPHEMIRYRARHEISHYTMDQLKGEDRGYFMHNIKNIIVKDIVDQLLKDNVINFEQYDACHNPDLKTIIEAELKVIK